MSNFTKSIVYSGIVLVAGLVAVFTLYNNMATTGANSFANMEPAAGEMARGLESDMSGVAAFLSDAVADDAEAATTLSTTAQTQDAADAAIENAKEELSKEMSKDAAEAIEDAKAEAQDSVEGEDAKASAAAKVEERSDEIVEEAAREAAEEAAKTSPAAGEEEHKDSTTEEMAQ